jgi:hypothetical protein
MKKTITPLILLACAVLAGSGCRNTGAIVVNGLRLELTGLERTADGAASASWRVVNPNVSPYLIAEVNSRIYLNGTLVGTILDKEPIGIQADGKVARTSKLVLAGPAAGQILVDAAAHGSVNYRVDSALRIQIYGDANETGNISYSGSVPVVSK